MSTWTKPSADLVSLLREDELRNLGGHRRDHDEDDNTKPGQITGVQLDFRVRERREKVRYSGIVTWNPIAPNTCAGDIRLFIIQVEPCNSAGVAKENGRRKRGFYFVKDEDDLDVDTLKEVFRDLEHGDRWYYHARVRVVTTDDRKGPWSDWTTPELPRRAARPRPPWPDNITVNFDKMEKGRDEARYRLKVRFDEIQFWDVPPTAERDKVTQNLSGGITAGANEIVLGSVAGVPIPGPKEDITFALRPNTDNGEIGSYSGVDVPNKKLTGVERGLEGTTAIAHPDNTNFVIAAEDAQDRQNDLRGYVVQVRRCNVDAVGNFVSWVKDPDDKFVQRTHYHSWKSEEDDGDGKVRSVFSNIRKRHWWRARVRTRAKYGLIGKWSDWTAPGSPSDTDDPPNISAPLLMEVDPRRIELGWSAPKDPDDADADDDLKELHPDIAYFQIQVSDRSDFNKALSTFWRNDNYHKTQTKTFRKKKTERGPFHARVRPVDSSGNKGNWLSNNRQRRKPGKPRNPRKERDVNAVVFKADAPNAWADGTTDEWDISEVAYYKLNVYQNGVLDAERSDPHVLTLRKRVTVPKNSTGWSAKWEAIGHEGETEGETLSTGTEVPGTLQDIGGALEYNQFGVFANIRIQASAPTSDLKDGDVWIDSDDGNKVYRYFSSAKILGGVSHGPGWVRAADGGDLIAGTVVADSIRSNYIFGLTVEGGVFKTATSGQRWEMSGTTLRAYDSGNVLRSSLYAISSGLQLDGSLWLSTPGTKVEVSGVGELAGINYVNSQISTRSAVGHQHSVPSRSDTTRTTGVPGNNESGGIASGSAGGAHTHFLGNHTHNFQGPPADHDHPNTT